MAPRKSNASPVVRVAIVGGGCAGLSAAFELTRPQHRGRFQVTIYQLGWRLGGKGASGRGVAQRIEEHGLHMWMGFYENAFRIMRECYEELDRDPAKCRIASIEQAFSRQPLLGVTEQLDDGSWDVWRAVLPQDDDLPGVRPVGAFSIEHYLERLAGLARTLLQDYYGEAEGEPPPATDIPASIERMIRYGQVGSLTMTFHAIQFLETVISSTASKAADALAQMLGVISSSALTALREAAKNDPAARRVWTLLDLTFASMRGILVDGLVTDPRGLDAISHYECREWLMMHGASRESVESGYMRGLYDLVFAYADGDPARPSIDAGQALRGVFRSLFTYRGSFFWRMNGGMGDIVFAPLYEVLKRRGVRFEFFHRLTRVGLAPDGGSPHVAELEFDVQAGLRTDTYQPLIDVDGLPCWPAAPLRDQIDDPHDADGTRDYEDFCDPRRVDQKTLRVGAHFDFAVLAVGLGVVPYVCREIIDADARWRAMVQRVQTVATQAFQLWLSADMATFGRGDGEMIVSGFVEPFDTWADMSHLIIEERFGERVRAIGYFCSALPEVTVAGVSQLAAAGIVRANAIRFLDEDIHKIWQMPAAGTGFPWQLLAPPDPVAAVRAAHPFDTQYWRANVNSSDRYTQSLPGSAAFRISPLDDSYDNFTVAGDWTECGFNAGCVEAAVMSGRLAAHALSGAPNLDEIVGYDHP
jgi:uncharacterized protein with NAD-binding domain and iron-sulfur cluster